MVDHQIDRVQRIDLLRIPPQPQNAVAHRRKVDHGRNTGEILHQDTGRAIGDLARVAAALFAPFGKGADIVHRHGLAIFEPQHVFQHHLQRGGQAGKGPQSGGFGGGDRIIGKGPAACGQGLAGFRAVMSDGYGHSCLLAVTRAGKGAKESRYWYAIVCRKSSPFAPEGPTDHSLAWKPSQFIDWRMPDQMARTNPSRRQDVPHATDRQRHVRTVPCCRGHGRGAADVTVCGGGRTVHLAGLRILPACG